MKYDYFPRLLKLIFSKYLIESKESERFTSSFPHRAFDRVGTAAGAGGRQGQAETVGGEEEDEEDGLRSGQR